jgi:hypothetical protein
MKRVKFTFSALIIAFLMTNLSLSQNVQLVGSIYNHWEQPSEVKIQGNYAYFATGETGMSIIDISNPSEPTEVGYIDTPGFSRSVAISGSNAYLADGDLRIIDISNPENPNELGFFDSSNNGIFDVSISDSYAYVAYNLSGLGIIDISNPAIPSLVGSFDDAHFTYHVCVRGNYCYFLDANYNNPKFRIIDISVASNPIEVSFLPYPSDVFCMDILVDSNIVYASLYNYGISVIDVSNPLQPVEIAHFITPTQSHGFCLSEAKLYIAVDGASFYIVDVASPSNPFFIGQANFQGIASCVAVSNNLAIVSFYRMQFTAGLKFFNVQNPFTPSCMTEIYPFGQVINSTIVGSIAYIADESGGVKIVDIANPANPIELGHFETPEMANDVAIVGDFAYVADCDSGLQVFNIVDPNSPIRVSSYDPPGTAEDILIQGDLAYIADGNFGLRIINVSNPLLPAEIGSYNTPGYALSIVIMGNYAYIADESQGLRILNISNPYSPTSVGYCLLPYSASARDIAITGDFALVAASNSSIYIINISNPTAPQYIGTIGGSFYSVAGIKISGNIMYVADSWAGLKVYNISNIFESVQTGCYNTGGSAMNITLSDDYIYVADKYYFEIFDCSQADRVKYSINTNPIYGPIIIPANGGTFHYYMNIQNLTIEHQTPMVWNKIRDTSNNYYTVFGPVSRTLPAIANPGRRVSQSIAGNIPSGSLCFISYIGVFPNIAHDSSYFYITKTSNTDGNPWIVQSEGSFIDDLNSVTLLPNSPASFMVNAAPNPFNPTTTLTFTLPHPARVSLEVFDINGRRVGVGLDPTRGRQECLPNQQTFDAGTHTIPFDGSDLPSGIYFARLSAGDFTTTQKMVLLK